MTFLTVNDYDQVEFADLQMHHQPCPICGADTKPHRVRVTGEDLLVEGSFACAACGAWWSFLDRDLFQHHDAELILRRLVCYMGLPWITWEA